MNEDKICRTFLVSDDPSDVDEFNGSHKRIAESIANLICTEEGGKSIGLEGEWGTGKSTVIKLLNETLNDMNGEDEFLLFIFDAWAHEADPLRRTFLEQLLTNIRKKNWITSEQWKAVWEENWKELIGRKTETLTKNSPQITLLGICIIVSSFLIPLGLALLNDGLRIGQNFNIFRGYPLGWQLFLGSLFTIAPLIVLVGNALWILIRRIFKLSITKTNWGVFVQKYDTETTTFTTKNPDPTSVEFESFFTALINDALQIEKRRIVIVLDNLDRITPTDALSILSTMQTFLQCETKLGREKLNKLWVLIPYDRKGLERLWDTHQDNKKDSEQINVASSMINKRFQVRFRVPPLVLSNWEDYFQKQLLYAFPDHNKSAFYPAYRIFYQYFDWSGKKKTPTPREIKLFINQIGTLHRQWMDKFPLVQMAYFVSLLGKNIDIPNSLLGGEIPESDLQDLLGEKVTENIAAMWFNVDVSLATQLLLEAPIQNAIIQRECEELHGLAEKHGISFWTIFDKLPFLKWATTEPINLANTAYCIEQDNILKIADARSLDSFISSLIQCATKVKKWQPFNEQMSEGISSLLRLSPDQNLSISMINKITLTEFDGNTKQEPQKVLGISELDSLKDEISPKIDGLVKLLFDTQKLGSIDYFLQHKLELNVDGYQFVEICGRLALDDPQNQLWKIFKSSVLPTEVTTVLVNIISNTTFTRRHIGAIHVLLDIMPEISFQKISDSIAARIQQPTSERLAELLESLWNLESRVDLVPVSAIEPLNQAGYILHHLIVKAEEKDFIACAWCVFLILKYSPVLSTQQYLRSLEGVTFLTQFLSSPDESNKVEILQHFKEIVETYEQLNIVLELDQVNPQSRNLVNSVLLYLAGLEDAEKYFSPKVICEYWHNIEQIVGLNSFDMLIAKLINNENTLQVIETSFSPENSGLYNSIYQALSSIHQEADFQLWLCKNLRTLDKNRWLDGLKAEDELIELLSKLLKNKVKVGLDINFSDAFVDYCEMLLNNQIQPHRYLAEWENFPKSVASKGIENNLVSGIIDKVKNVANIPTIFFDLYGNLIERPKLLMENIDVVRKLFSPLVETRNLRGLQWFSELLQRHHDLFKNIEDDDEVVVFKKRLNKALIQNSDEMIRKYLEEIAKILKVEKVISEEESLEVEEKSAES